MPLLRANISRYDTLDSTNLSMMFCDACMIVFGMWPAIHQPWHHLRPLRIGEQIRGCASAVLRVCNMIELVHAKLTHTYAAARRLLSQVCPWAVLCWCFQCFRFVRASWRREGCWISPPTFNSGSLRLHNHYQKELERNMAIFASDSFYLLFQIAPAPRPFFYVYKNDLQYSNKLGQANIEC